MTIREMIDAMLAGKTLIRPNGTIAYYDPDDEDCGPWVYILLEKTRMGGAWYYTDWSIKQEPKKRFMTCKEVIGFCANTRGIVVRYDEEEWLFPERFVFSEHIDHYEWAIMDIKGRIIDGPHKFEVEE